MSLLCTGVDAISLCLKFLAHNSTVPQDKSVACVMGYGQTNVRGPNKLIISVSHHLGCACP